MSTVVAWRGPGLTVRREQEAGVRRYASLADAIGALVSEGAQGIYYSGPDGRERYYRNAAEMALAWGLAPEEYGWYVHEELPLASPGR